MALDLNIPSVHMISLSISKRWIFNLIHGHIIGVGVTILACKSQLLMFIDHHFVSVINIGIGISLLENGDHKILWLYIAFNIIWIIFQLTLFVGYTLNAYKAPEKGDNVIVIIIW